MFPKSSLPFAPVSGFVAFDGGGAMPPSVAHPKRPRIVHTPAAEPAAIEPEAAPVVEGDVAPGLRRTAGWQSGHGLRARRVEGALLIGIVGYFVAATLGGLQLF
jgi:hypothetical protein